MRSLLSHLLTLLLRALTSPGGRVLVARSTLRFLQVGSCLRSQVLEVPRTTGSRLHRDRTLEDKWYPAHISNSARDLRCVRDGEEGYTTWLESLVDNAEGYNIDGKTELMEHLRKLEETRNFYEKGVFDYTYSLDRCFATGAPYIAMFEDDIIIADGWMAKTRRALLDVEARSYEDLQNWIYLRLFYTETSMSWQDTDFWYANMPLTFGLASFASLALLVLIRASTPLVRLHLDNWALVILCVISVPSFIALLFMMGKYSLFPLEGVFEQDKYGCCTQALVFPRAQVNGLRAYFRGIGLGQTDTMIENYADETGMKRYALAPQLVQHVGLKSSRDNTLMNSQSTWAFYFETYDPATLKADHLALTGDSED